MWSKGNRSFSTMTAMVTKNKYDKEQMDILKLYCHDAALAFVKDNGLYLLKYTDMPTGMDSFLKHILTASGDFIFLKQTFMPLIEALDLYRLKYKFIVSASKTLVTVRKVSKSEVICDDFVYNDDQVCEVNCTDIIKQTSPTCNGKSGVKAKKLTPGKKNLIEHLKKSLATPVQSEKAMKMMRNMGWDGGSLGTRGDGILEPIALDLDLNARAGLGHVKETPQETSTNLKNQKHILLMGILEKLLEFLKSEETSIEIQCPSEVTKTEHRFLENLIHMMRLRKRLKVKNPVRSELLRNINEEMVRLECLQVTYNIIDNLFIVFRKIPMVKGKKTAKKVKGTAKISPETPERSHVTSNKRSNTPYADQDMSNDLPDTGNSCKDVPYIYLDTSSSSQDIPNTCLDSPNSGQGVPVKHTDIPNVLPNTPNKCKGIPKNGPMIPNNCRDAPNKCQDILNSTRDSFQKNNIIKVEELTMRYISRRYVHPFCPLGVANKFLNNLVFRCSVLVYMLDFIKSDRNQTEIVYGYVLCTSAREFVNDIVRVVNKGHNKKGSKTVVEKYLMKEILKTGKKYYMVGEFSFLNTSIIFKKVWLSKKSKSNLSKHTDYINTNGTSDNINDIFAILDKAFPLINLPKIDTLSDNTKGEHINDFSESSNPIVQIHSDADTTNNIDGKVSESKNVPKVNSDRHDQNIEVFNSTRASDDSVIIVSDTDDNMDVLCTEINDKRTPCVEGSSIDEAQISTVRSVKKPMRKRNKKKKVSQQISDCNSNNIEIKKCNIDVILQEGIKSITIKDNIEDSHPKRVRSDSEASELKVSKKHKATNNFISAYLSPKDSSKVDIDFVRRVQSSILNKIDNTNDGLPHLKCHGVKDGQLVYSCHSEKSLQWLNALCIDSDVKLIIKDDLQEEVNMSLKIHSYVEQDYKKIFRRLELYNKGLSTSQWVWLKEEKFLDFLVIMFKIDDNAYSYIKNANFRLFAGVDEAQFSVVWD